MKTQNRDKRFGKTSDKARTAAGILLAAGSVLLCLVPVFTAPQPPVITCRSGGLQPRSVNPIPTERNGSIRVNEASPEELTELYGIGETLAAMIVVERAENGPFHYAEDLVSVKGIGPRTLERFRDMIDLSTDESEE